jgi:hypothetical protein
MSAQLEKLDTTGLIQTDIDNPCEELRGLYDAASLAAKWAARHFKMETVDETTQKIRISICQTCPKFHKIERRCLECCCPMDFKTTLLFDPYKSGLLLKKTKIVCPMGKW